MKLLIASKEDKASIASKLSEFNFSKLPMMQSRKYIDMSMVVKDGDTLIGGADAYLYNWNVLFIEMLFVEESYRKSGIGSKIINAVEEQARKQGATLAHLTTYDFQAKGFYEKHGYETFGILDGYPDGHKRFFMRKFL